MRPGTAAGWTMLTAFILVLAAPPGVAQPEPVPLQIQVGDGPRIVGDRWFQLGSPEKQMVSGFMRVELRRLPDGTYFYRFELRVGSEPYQETLRWGRLDRYLQPIELSVRHLEGRGERATLTAREVRRLDPETRALAVTHPDGQEEILTPDRQVVVKGLELLLFPRIWAEHGTGQDVLLLDPEQAVLEQGRLQSDEGPVSGESWRFRRTLRPLDPEVAPDPELVVEVAGPAGAAALVTRIAAPAQGWDLTRMYPPYLDRAGTVGELTLAEPARVVVRFLQAVATRDRTALEQSLDVPALAAERLARLETATGQEVPPADRSAILETLATEVVDALLGADGRQLFTLGGLPVKPHPEWLETRVDGEAARVELRIPTGKLSDPIVFHLRRLEGSWRIYRIE